MSPYITSGFLGLQYGIEEAFLEIVDDTVRYELFKAGGNQTSTGNGAKNSVLGTYVKAMLVTKCSHKLECSLQKLRVGIIPADFAEQLMQFKFLNRTTRISSSPQKRI